VDSRQRRAIVRNLNRLLRVQVSGELGKFMPDSNLLRRNPAESIPAHTEVPTITGMYRLTWVSAAINAQTMMRPTVKRMANHVLIVVCSVARPNAPQQRPAPLVKCK
jgi:hypothetical protein